MTRDETKELLEMIDIAFPNSSKGMSPERMKRRIDLWASALVNDEFDAIRVGLTNFVQTDTSGFAPSIGQLRNATFILIEDDYDDTEEAMALIRKAVNNGIYHSQWEFDNLPSDIQKTVGCHENLRNWAMMDTDTFESVQLSHLRRAYRTIQDRNKQLAKVSPINRAKLEQIHRNLDKLYARSDDTYRLPFQDDEERY